MHPIHARQPHHDVLGALYVGTPAAAAGDELAWVAYADSVADWIVNQLRPLRVVDFGPSLDGRLARALSARGVEVAVWALGARGIEVTVWTLGARGLEVAVRTPDEATSSDQETTPDQATAQADRQGSTSSTGRPGQANAPAYDLAIALESLPPCSAHQVESTLEELCAASDDLLFSASPLGSQPGADAVGWLPDEWAVRLAGRDFFHDLDFDATPMTPWAARFRRSSGGAAIQPALIGRYERQVWRLAEESRVRRALALEQQAAIADRDASILGLHLELEDREHSLEVLKDRLADGLAELARSEADGLALAHELEALQGWQSAVEAGAGWQVLQRVQGLRGALAPPGSRRARWLGGLLGEGDAP